MSQIPCTGKDDCPWCLLILALGLALGLDQLDNQPSPIFGKVVHD